MPEQNFIVTVLCFECPRCPPSDPVLLSAAGEYIECTCTECMRDALSGVATGKAFCRRTRQECQFRRIGPITPIEVHTSAAQGSRRNESAFEKSQRWRLALLTNKKHVRSSK
jgi:hypothetical protein